MECQWISLSGRFGHQSVPRIHFGGRVTWAAQCDSQRCEQRHAGDESSHQTAASRCTHSKVFLNRTHLYLPGSPALPWATILFFSASKCLPFFSFCTSATSLFLFKSPASACVSVCPTASRLAEESWRPPCLCSALSPACHCSALCATLACFVNNHLFVAGIVAAITSDLPVSSIMDRLLDVNICKSLLLNSPPG